jgi:hypothetical protein
MRVSTLDAQRIKDTAVASLPLQWRGVGDKAWIFFGVVPGMGTYSYRTSKFDREGYVLMSVKMNSIYR